ncbi:hypothetical protein QVD17_09152 [Tagetes erecta]|uniref:BTB domain-containing protein n=1 Tax=Tagetes erecta TaxID=13708 RepID=A0AAD8P4Z4_TARER|nr:hypothetical protein QVD17_09152 [Tagetes erecta]
MQSNFDVFDHGDFGFAFNNRNFSDRVLRIYIYSESTQSPLAKVKTLYVSSAILAGRSPFFYKLFSNGMRESAQCHAILRINASEEVALMEVLKFMYSNSLTVTTSAAVLDVLIVADKFDVASCMRHCSRLLRNQREFDVFDHRMAVLDSSEDGCDHDDFGFTFNESNLFDRVLRMYIFSESTQAPSAARVKTLYISSAILGAKSPFFYKLFSNSTQCQATLQIKASDEAGVMELLKFMYSNSLTVTTAYAVFDVLMAAHKFDVASCMRHCCRLLSDPLIMTPEFALFYLDLPSTILTTEAFHPLTVAVRQFFAVHYKDITRFKDESCELPLDCVETLLASDDLQVVSEDEVFLFVVDWVRAHYDNMKDRRGIIRMRLGKYIRFPYMTHKGLWQAMCSDECDRCFVLGEVAEALLFKENELPVKRMRKDKYRRFVKRTAYRYRPLAFNKTWITLCISTMFIKFFVQIIKGHC